MPRIYANKSNHPAPATTTGSALPVDDNPVTNAFRQYALELDDKHDRYERIVKISRDITIESKRIIFLLHTMDKSNSPKDSILSEAQSRLSKLIDKNFAQIAAELSNHDPYQYARAFSAGLQEFVEALTYLDYMSNRPISDWNALQQRLTYPIETPAKLETNDADETGSNKAVVTNQCIVDPMEFVLGIGDLSGEVMRRSIYALGSGDFETCFQSCRFLQTLYTGFIGLSQHHSKAMSNKVFTLRQSMQKVELVCYNIKVRGREACKADIGGASDQQADVDEGFSNY